MPPYAHSSSPRLLSLYPLILALIILLSACASFLTPSTEPDTPIETVQVTSLAISPTYPRPGELMTVRLSLQYVGTQEAELTLGNNGLNVLANYCESLFTMERFLLNSVRTPQNNELTLFPGESVDLEWEIRAPENVKSDVRCTIQLVPKVTLHTFAYQQLLLAPDKVFLNPPFVPSLQSTVQDGPVLPAIELPSGTTYRTDREIIARIYFQNQESGILTLSPKDVKISSTLPGTCTQPPRFSVINGRTTDISCTYRAEPGTHPYLGEITVEATYQYAVRSQQEVQVIS